MRVRSVPAVVLALSIPACAASAVNPSTSAPTPSASAPAISASSAAPSVAPTSSAASAASAPIPTTCASGRVAVPAGAYERAADKAPVQVAAHCLDRTEVTVAAYRACVDAKACTAPDAVGAGKAKACNWQRKGAEDHPVNCVDHAQASAYCAWAGGRLPTEGEWEWSARGEAAATKHPWGNEPLRGRGCFDDDSRESSPDGTCRAGQYPTGANPRGVVDLTGNVWEWTASPGSKPDEAIDRGGGWLNGDEGMLSIGRRNGVPKGSRYSSLGFRCAG